MSAGGAARKATVLIVEDDRTQLQFLTSTIEKLGRYVTIPLTDPRAALEIALEEEPDAVITDVAMPQMSGIELTAELRGVYPALPIIVVTALTGSDSARGAFAAGATDFATKPLHAADVAVRLETALARVPQQEILLKAVEDRYIPSGILGSDPKIEAVRDVVRHVSTVANVSVLILGESGTGKNLVARAIHAASPQAGRRFVEVNCAALPENLLEAEIFGFEKGAFTGAQKTKRGLAEVADGGTLFLDEIGTMPTSLQAKLLTFLESRTFRRVGCTEDLHANLRIVAATNLNLQGEVEGGRFREDLFYRLNVARIELPALREIRSDVGTLAVHFLERAADYFSRPLPGIAESSVRRLSEYDWPGNARELRNVIERALIFSSGPTLNIDPFIPSTQAGLGAGDGQDAEVATPSASLPLGLTLDEVERRYIQATLEDVHHNVTEAAERLGVTRKVLWSRRKKHGLL